jgi:hypothetical protein
MRDRLGGVQDDGNRIRLSQDRNRPIHNGTLMRRFRPTDLPSTSEPPSPIVISGFEQFVLPRRPES